MPATTVETPQPIAPPPLALPSAGNLTSSATPASAPTRTTPVWKGFYYPLGATWTGEGVNFALFSENATGVELCLFDRLGQNETNRVRLTERANHVWHAFLPEIRPG